MTEWLNVVVKRNSYKNINLMKDTLKNALKGNFKFKFC